MRSLSGRTIILIGFVLVFLGFFIPLLIVTKVIASTFVLNFFSFTASTLGLFLGVIGAASYVRERRK
jgi:hypothetical protein